jgi:hypothetical protein
VSNSDKKFDMEVFHAKWVIGSIEPEEFVEIAISALQQGFDGTALQQLAGLSKPTTQEIGDLPKRFFSEQGLKPITKEEAVDFLIARGELSRPSVFTALRQAFPDFSDRWKKYIIEWHGSSGSFIDMAEFMHFVVEDLYENGNLAETRRAFNELEKLLENADEETRGFIEFSFFEDLQNYASHRPGGNAVYEQFFGPISRQIWAELKQIWAGKSSLAYVIHAENKAKRGK